MSQGPADLQSVIEAARPQAYIDAEPFDSWLEPSGTTVAYFYRVAGAIRVRFPGLADFLIETRHLAVRAIPASETTRQETSTLFENCIKPLVRNHGGGVTLHGSAACIGGNAVGFMGVSRRGKTTLAGAFAQAGHPFLTEDVLALERDGNAWRVLPISSPMRLFPDSASHFDLGEPAIEAARAAKVPVGDAGHLPRATEAAPLAAVYLLGPGSGEGVAITPLEPSEALAELLQHAFILDVEDRGRLASHFGRMADLASAVPCRQLDYPRRFEFLPEVIAAVVDDLSRT